MEEVHLPLALEWSFRPLHPPKPAWPEPSEEAPRSHADNAFYVITGDGAAYFASSVDNSVRAVDIVSGRIRWTFYTHGPVRFAPSFHEGRVYFGSDDGCVYCVTARNGSLAWKHRAGPNDTRAIGNGRIISAWPVRTSVLVEKGELFFCAGVFPFEGLYVCALNAGTGELIWKNDTIGDRAHDLHYGGISPQSYLVASDDVLFVPSGRAMPAAFDRKTGKFLYYTYPGAKRGGTWAVLEEDRLIAGVDHSGSPEKVSYSTGSGKGTGTVYAWFPGIDMAIAKDRSYTLTREGIYAIDRAAYAIARKTAGSISTEQKSLRAELSTLKKKRGGADGEALNELDERMENISTELIALDQAFKDAKASSYPWYYPKKDLSALIHAGKLVFAGGDGFVAAVDDRTGEELWSAKVDGRACGLSAGDGRLFVATDKGPVYCFGKGGRDAQTLKTRLNLKPYPTDDLSRIYTRAADRLVNELASNKGYCLVLDCGEGRLAYELAIRTDMKIVGIEKDEKKREAARDKLFSAGLWGDRVVVEPWDVETLPRWFANLVVSDANARTGEPWIVREEVGRVLRPCGGMIVSFGEVETGKRDMEIQKRSALQGAGSWTQLYANAQNTACSMDDLVKPPLKVLWYGEPGPRQIVDRHGRACGPVSIDGRIFYQGEEVVMAYDAYNGAFLWKREIPGAVRVRVDVDSGNLALTKEGLYVAAFDKCLRLDPATGRTVNEYGLPKSQNGEPRRWGYIAAEGDTLFGTAAKPLKNEYAAQWKKFVDTKENDWKTGDEITQELRDDSDYEAFYEKYRSSYSEPAPDLYRKLQRDGAFWHPVADFPSWGSQKTPKDTLNSNLMSGDVLFAVDADTGRPLWAKSGNDIPNIAVSLGNGTIYFPEGGASPEDRANALEELETLVESGVYEEGEEARLLTPEQRDVRLVKALDTGTGRVVWEKAVDLSGCGGNKMGSALADGVLLFFGHFSNHDTGFFLGHELTWRRVTALDASTGEMLWSRPLNYLRRPLVVGDQVIIEPRACDLHTGKIKTREHPISGKRVPWEFLRPGHCCSVTSASAHTLFYRSYWGAIYDLANDRGLSLFGGIRPGCWLNMISANGLMLMPEASSGCTCSFPLRCTVALAPEPDKVTSNWTVFITHGDNLPVKRLCVNFGAPGDMKDRENRLWLAWPRPRVVSSIGYHNYAMSFELKAEIAKGMGPFKSDFKGVTIDGSDKPWLFKSGVKGIEKLTIPLTREILPGRPNGIYTVKLGFVADDADSIGQRVFDVKIQGKARLKRFDLMKSPGAHKKAVVKEFTGIEIDNDLVVEFMAHSDEASPANAPLLNWIEVIREDVENLAAWTMGAEINGKMSAEEILAGTEAMHLTTGDKYKDSILSEYHMVFSSLTAPELTMRALDGMEKFADPKSLPHIKACWEHSKTILSGYKAVQPDVLNGTVRVCLAIAEKMKDGEERKRALESTLPVLPDITDAGLGRMVTEKLGYITEWQVLGPIPWDEGADSVEEIYDSSKAVTPGKAVMLGKEELAWKECTVSRTKIDLQKVFGTMKKVSAYAFCEIKLDKPCDLLLNVGSDDGFKCWFNREHVGGHKEKRSWSREGTTIEVRGKQGRNTILLQIIDRAGSGWAFSARVTRP